MNPPGYTTRTPSPRGTNIRNGKGNINLAENGCYVRKKRIRANPINDARDIRTG